MSALYAALYGPTADELRRSLPEIGEHLQRSLESLSAEPTAEMAERIAVELDGARRAVMRFRERLLVEGRSDGR